MTEEEYKFFKKEGSVPRSTTKSHIDKLLMLLERNYPGAGTALRHRDPLQLLIATILSAQCTDERVNQVTKTLFKKYRKASDYANARREELEEDIRPTGFFRNKAKSIIGCCKALVEEHGGEVPDSLDELVKLPGVGRKTANVVLGMAFGIPGIVVDTHVKRVSIRLGLTEENDPDKIEFDLMRTIPKAKWTVFSSQLILHGRSLCSSRKPKCDECFLLDMCDFGKREVERN
ncbi:MAG: endonuclease III [Candidatus Glassbacteria bacterium]